MKLIQTPDELADAVSQRPHYVAECLSRINRFGGQAMGCDVLRHTLEVFKHVVLRSASNHKAILYALLHDVHEVLTGDVVRPYVTDSLTKAQRDIDDILRGRFPDRLPDIGDPAWELVRSVDHAVGQREYTKLQTGLPDRYELVYGESFSDIAYGMSDNIPLWAGLVTNELARPLFS